jgi:hypothetical protein
MSQDPLSCLVDPFKKDHIETLFEHGAKIEYLGKIARAKQKPEVKCHGVTIELEKLSFWSKVRLLFFGHNPSMELCDTIVQKSNNNLVKEETLADLIIKSLDNEPQKWTLSEYRISHNNGTSVWISNGQDHVGIWDGSDRKMLFNAKERKAIWEASERFKKSHRESQERDLKEKYKKRFK